ncbi:MAG: PfkB family carbohydrate kinase [Candidatus Methanoperedens sp.]
MNVTVIGDAFIDIIIPAEEINLGETYHRKVITLCGGTANVAIQLSNFITQVQFIGKIGNDVFGTYFKQNLSEKDVEPLLFVDYKNQTGLCTSLVYENGERTMIADRGANDYIEMNEIKNNIKDITKSKIVYFSGYSLISNLTSESILYAMQECHDKCEIWFNPGAPNIIKKEFKEIIRKYVNVLILNLDEAKNITGFNKLDDILKSLGDIVDVAVVTMGGDGCIISKKNKNITIKSEFLKASDTTGAGDAFSAGYLFGRLQEMADVDCAKLGNETAAKLLMEKKVLLK